MHKISEETEKVMLERFSGDSLISLATCSENIPYVRTVNAYYENGSFYILTYALSGKMKQLEKNPTAAVSGEWFTAHGRGINLGWFGSDDNKLIADKMKNVFSEWIDNGHNNFDDKNTCILRIALTEGILFSEGKRLELKFGENENENT